MAIDWRTTGCVPYSPPSFTMQQSSRLLLLPAEVRNNIYYHLISSGLFRSSSAVFRTEFLPLFNVLWPSSTTRVICGIHNLEFDELIKLLERLNGEARSALVRDEGLKIQLSFDRKIKAPLEVLPLGRWLVSCVSDGTGLTTTRGQYEFVGTPPEPNGYFGAHNLSSKFRTFVSAGIGLAGREWEGALRAYRLRMVELGRETEHVSLDELIAEARAMGFRRAKRHAESIAIQCIGGAVRVDWFDPSFMTEDVAWLKE
ncbi:hypothetical protein LTR85_001434 [Meristemomyces frigidus]|nr:hypothetical protein LTR85_001434 [Meristemomyces frigidus]